MSDVLVFYVTAPDAATADVLANGLVAGGHAKCVNIISTMRALYRWQDKIETAEESVLIVKTTAPQAEAARAFIVAEHPYDLPAIIAFQVDPTASHAPYLKWLADD